jgi:hypothetical protein
VELRIEIVRISADHAGFQQRQIDGLRPFKARSVICFDSTVRPICAVCICICTADAVTTMDSVTARTCNRKSTVVRAATSTFTLNVTNALNPGASTRTW